MMRDKAMHKQDGTLVQRSKTTFNDPLKWKDPSLIFTCSWSDFFIKQADEWRGEAWEIILDKTPFHQYQILTKRPQFVADRVPMDRTLFSNVWLGVSVENNKALSRIKYFSRLQNEGIRFPVRFISFEPLLERIDLCWLDELWSESPYEWAILGGESGNDSGPWAYRPCDIDWLHELHEFHAKRRVPIFVKQTGVHIAKQLGLKTRIGTDTENLPPDYRHLDCKKFPVWYHLWKDSTKTGDGIFNEQQ